MDFEVVDKKAMLQRLNGDDPIETVDDDAERKLLEFIFANEGE